MGTRRFAFLLIAGTVVGAAAPGCYGGGDEQGTGCVSDRQYFQREVWGAFMANNCARCHTPDGVASAKGARFILQPSSYPGFIDANLATLREMARNSYDGKNILLQKPVGAMNHGGGKVIEQDGDEYRKLAGLIERFSGAKSGASCDSRTHLLDGVTALSPADTARKASIDLGGRVPSEGELASIVDEATLDAFLDKLMKEPTFLTRVREMYNDLVLTDQFLQYDGRMLGTISEALYPPLKDYVNNGPKEKDPRRPLINRALAREPVDLIAYIVKNDRPFTEVLTADYTVVNPYSNAIYAAPVTFADPNDYEDFKEAKLNQYGPKGATPVPHAGVLSTPAFLNRWQTTPTNRNRARARRVFQFFLATDVLKIAERPVDASKLTAKDNPTRNSEYCNVCHKVLDPVAGGFRGWNEFDYEEFEPDAPWHDDMEEPGFADKQMDPSYYSKGLQWLVPELAKDPRFATAAVHAAYKGLTGRKPMAYPTDPKDPGYQGKIDAWEAQDQFFRDTAAAFTKANSNFKVIIKAIVKSAYYRGTAWTGDATGADARLADVGVGQLLSPEALNRKIVATTGMHWRKWYDFPNQHDWLLDTYDSYNILYGGIDSEYVTDRTTVPNGLMANVAQRMANELACKTTANDFARPDTARVLFPGLTPDVVPEANGAPAPDGVAKIKQTIKRLHWQLLGERVEIGDPELERTYGIFLDTWKEVVALGKDKVYIDYECQGRWDTTTGAELPQAQRIEQDKTGAVRAWQAVVTYLLMDWKFLTH